MCCCPGSIRFTAVRQPIQAPQQPRVFLRFPASRSLTSGWDEWKESLDSIHIHFQTRRMELEEVVYVIAYIFLHLPHESDPNVTGNYSIWMV